MRLLLFTQIVDEEDAVLGFVSGWIRALAPHYESLTVISLKEGTHTFPKNVHVHSLGKERNTSNIRGIGRVMTRLRYVCRFYYLLWKTRGTYDAVLVHMNQEYLLLAGWLWHLQGIPAYLWRNYHSGNLGTRIAVWFSRRVFYTSRSSYIARFNNAIRMPVGIGLAQYVSSEPVNRIPNSILSLGRISPDKRLDTFVEALGILATRNIQFSAHLYGDALPEHTSYRDSLIARIKELGIAERVFWYKAVPNKDTSVVYRAHEIFVNLSPSGMYDKTIFEAAASGCLVLASSADFAEEMGEKLSFFYGDAVSLADKLVELLASSGTGRVELQNSLAALAERHSLVHLIERFTEQIV